MELDLNEASSMSADYKNWSDRGSCPNLATVDCALNLVLVPVPRRAGSRCSNTCYKPRPCLSLSASTTMIQSMVQTKSTTRTLIQSFVSAPCARLHLPLPSPSSPSNVQNGARQHTRSAPDFFVGTMKRRSFLWTRRKRFRVHAEMYMLIILSFQASWHPMGIQRLVTCATKFAPQVRARWD